MSEKIERPKYEVAVISAKPMFLQVEKGDETRWNRELVFALQIVRGSDALQKCTSDSIMNAIVNLATIGISLNPALALAYLVPRGGKCVLDVGYRGMTKIATDSGSVIDVDATVVYEKDLFEYEMGLNPILKHKPCLSGDKGKPSFVYAVAVLHNGMKKFIVLDRAEIEKVKSTSKARSGPWIEWEPEMWRKTAVKKLFKLLPQTEQMSQCIQVLNEHEGLSDKETHSQTFMNTFAKEEAAKEEVTEAEIVETATGADIPVSLPMVYRMLADLCKLTGDNPDDKISELSGGSFPMQQDLEQASQKQLKVIRAKLDAALAVAAMD